MKKVFLIHGFQGSPNGGWRPWLMAELDKQDIYACALPMPKPDAALLSEWLGEINRHIDMSSDDEIYLVGHSLGVPTIMRFLEGSTGVIKGAVLVSGPCKKNNNRKIDNFLETEFDYNKIKQSCEAFVVIHGDNDPYVPLEHAEIVSKELNCPLVVIPNGGHLNRASGFPELPAVLEELSKMMK